MLSITTEQAYTMAINAKLTGTLFETLFSSECLRRKIVPCIPVGDFSPYDFVTISYGGKISRVQVKGTSTPNPNTSGKGVRYKIHCKQGRSNMIDCRHVDVVVAYVAPCEAWYLIPCEVVTTTTFWLYPSDSTSEGKSERYKANWDILQ